jgi:hypothetical protein
MLNNVRKLAFLARFSEKSCTHVHSLAKTMEFATEISSKQDQGNYGTN